MAEIVLLVMGGEGARAAEVQALGSAGHSVLVVEPRFPECQASLAGKRPDLVLVDGHASPSHGRATASWLNTRLRTVPFLFLDVADADVAKVTKEIPRAQFGTWSSVVEASERLVSG